MARALLGLALVFCSLAAWAQGAGSRNLAAGFTKLEAQAAVVILPIDVELFALGAGGVSEPKADWTADTLRHMKSALGAKKAAIGLRSSQLDDKAADEFGEQMSLHAAVAGSIALHHSVGGMWALPTKDGKLDWSFGQAMQPIQAKTGARYGLFIWVRDSYATAERKLAMVGLALLGVGMAGGTQIGYASLVDLQTGQVMWFNRLARAWGDLREATGAVESINALLSEFPSTK